MEYRTKKWLDYFAGGLLMGGLMPLVWLLGKILRREHALEVRGTLCFIKMLGGGSLVIAYPALLGLRDRYPQATFSLITTKGTAPLARTLGVFDRIDEVDDSSLVRLLGSGLRSLWKNFHADTTVDLEVYSRLTTVLSSLTCARNRLGFYLDIVFWRKHLHTHTVFFNRHTGSYRWYQAIARVLGAEPASIERCRRLMRERFGGPAEPAPQARRIAVGHACSDFGRERMLTEQQWLAVFEQRLPPSEPATVLFLGVMGDRPLANTIIDALARRFPSARFENLCGKLPLADSVLRLATCQEFWGIDSALLHYARLLGLKCVSYWGPTDPATRLCPIPGLEEEIRYGKVPCSPCIHIAGEPPCHGNNVCIQSLFGQSKDYETISWIV